MAARQAFACEKHSKALRQPFTQRRIFVDQSWVGIAFGVSASSIVAFTGDVVCAFIISNEQRPA